MKRVLAEYHRTMKDQLMFFGFCTFMIVVAFTVVIVLVKQNTTEIRLNRETVREACNGKG